MRRSFFGLCGHVCIGVLVVCASLGCTNINRPFGYEPGSAHATDVQTVAVELFENQTFSRGTEVMLADALNKEIQLRTPWRIASPETADTVLQGVITREDLVPLTTGRETGMVQEMAVRLVTEFTWRDQRSGQVRVSRRSFIAAETFIPSRRVGERIDIGRLGAVQELASAIVGELRADW
ncbi:MAG: hypothetical protein H6815_10255 [Phycisphaeraceae bacterium]|nr:hypothetical protein [Phycisphaerales bacterium]MCB9860821.1 hypothetical protein [Phycisphaeraceae bacterium]